MKTKKWLYKKLPTLALALAILFFSASLVGSRSYNNTDRAAEELTSRIQNRLRLLDGYIEKAADSRYEDELLHLNLPEDMVIYSYVNDSLVSWNNQFPLLNDDISYRHVFYRMMDHEDFVISPLAGITDEISYINIGTKWYLAKYFQIDAEHKIIAGLEIQNSLVNDARKNENGINPQLKLPGKYSIIPLNTVGGSAVEIDDKPLFKIIQENNISIAEANHMILRWFSLAFLVLALIVFLAGHRSLKNFTIVVFSLTLIFLFGLLWGFRMNGISEFFSPTIYADGPIFSSLGALILINSYIVLLCLCCFYIRDEVVASIRRKNNNHRRSLTIYGIFSLSFAIFLAIYVHLSLKSLLLNSNISLELYRWNTNIPYTITVYLSYVCLLFCIIGQLHLLRPVINFFTGHKYNLLSHKVLIIYATLCALYLTGISSYLGFRKEEDRVSVWANRV